MKAKRITKIVFSAAVLTAVTFGFISCKKEKPTVAVVHVLDGNGDPVDQAYVHLYGTPSGPQYTNAVALDTTAMTNSAGVASVDYSDYYKMGQAGFAVLDVDAYKGALYGSSIIKIEEQATTEITIQF